jgi:hypothetical protein
MLPTKFQFFWPSGYRGEYFLAQPIRNMNCLWWPCLLMDRDTMSNLYTEPSIDASYQIQKIKIQFIWLRGFRGED